MQAFPFGSVALTGSAADNVGVTTVRVSIKRNDLPAGSNWWNGSGWGAFTFVTATLTNPGGANTDWSYTFNPPATGVTTGYGFQVRAVDSSANLGANTLWRNFSVTP
jgi:hypothetical protein